MKQKTTFFILCLGIYLTLFVVEEAIFTVILTLLQAPYYANFLISIMLTVILNPIITWIIVNRMYVKIAGK